MEQSRGQHQKALHGLSPNAILDDLCYADEEEQEGQEEDVWERPSSIQRPYAVNHQMLEMHTQLSAAVKHVPKHVGPLQQFASQHHANSVLEQQSLTVHAQAAEPHHEQEIQQQQELHFSMQPRSLAAADGTISGTAVCSLPHVPLCVMNASQRGTSANAKHNSAASLTDAVQQCAAAEQSDVGTEAVQLPTHQAGAVPVSDGALPVHTEQSDRELALRLQQEEHAVQHQQARPVSKRLLTVKSDCKKTNSIQSFFKKA